MIYVLFIFLILIIYNYLLSIEKFNNEEDNKNFDKYRELSNKLKNKYGSCNYTPSHIVEELPQISWNGYFVNDLFIKKEYRKKGYGTLLMKKLISISQKEGKLHLISQVVAKNKPAIKLHENVGFVVHSKGLNKNNDIVLIYVYYL
jgi:GNAT superfamily N-acetyltransferase